MTPATAPVRFRGDPKWLPPDIKTLYRKKGKIIYVGRFSGAERKILHKRPAIAVSRWAERHRVLTMSKMPGPWRNEVTPYLAGIMDAAGFPSVRTVIMCKAPQMGGSEAANNFIGYTIDRAPGPALFVYPDEGTARENSMDRIQPMITSSPRLRSYRTPYDDDLATYRIKLTHTVLYLAWARSAARLANRPIKYIVFDETDKYPDTAGKKEADPISLGEKRAVTYRYDHKIFKISTPTTEKGVIWHALNHEAQEIFDWFVRCPFCRHPHIMAFERIQWPDDERDPETVLSEDLAWYACPKCNARWNDMDRDEAVRSGWWQGRSSGLRLDLHLAKHRPGKVGFHMPSWISPFVGLSKVAAAFLAGLASKTKLRDFLNNHKAEPWIDYKVERDEDAILALADDRPRGQVPGDGRVCCLTAGVDTQKYGFWFEIRAWGYGMKQESWQVREGYVTSYDALEQVLFEDEYRDPSGRVYPVWLAVQDAMGGKWTADVYDFCRKHRKRLLPFKGEQRMLRPYQFSNIDVYPGTSKRIPGGIRLVRADTTYYKNLLSEKLEIAPADPGAWHLHSETSVDWARQMCAEYTDDRGIWVCPDGKDNHAWDVSVYNLVAADILGVKYVVKKAAAKTKSEKQKTPKSRRRW